MVIGYDHTDDLIWVLGGHTGSSLFSFDVSIWNESDAIYDEGRNALSLNTDASGQSYVQVNNILYCIALYYDNLLEFDVFTGDPNLTYAALSPIYTSRAGCLASIDDYIIYTWLENTFVFSISEQKWTQTGLPLMNIQRHSCMVEPISGYL